MLSRAQQITAVVVVSIVVGLLVGGVIVIPRGLPPWHTQAFHLPDVSAFQCRGWVLREERTLLVLALYSGLRPRSPEFRELLEVTRLEWVAGEDHLEALPNDEREYHTWIKSLFGTLNHASVYTAFVHMDQVCTESFPSVNV